jgi:hypothetical protein
MNLFARFIGVITSPRDTFTAVAASPKWLGMAIVVIAITAATQLWFQSTEVGKLAMVDESIRRVEAFGVTVTPQMEQEMTRRIMEPSTTSTVTTLLTMAAVPPIIWAAMAGIAFVLFGAMMGGDAKFKQVYAAVVHSGVVSAIGTVFITPLNYMRESMTSATNLAVLMPFLPEGSFLARFFGMVDLFVIWWVVVLAIGLAVTFKKKTSTVATTLFVIYGVIAVGFAAFMAARS